ncbi:7061_t:CDS:2, partial [Gigaspora rosea]
KISLASQVINDDSELVKNLEEDAKEDFMKPFQCMKVEAPTNIKEIYEELANVILEILDSLNNIWKNPAFEIQFAES